MGAVVGWSWRWKACEGLDPLHVGVHDLCAVLSYLLCVESFYLLCVLCHWLLLV